MNKIENILEKIQKTLSSNARNKDLSDFNSLQYFIEKFGYWPSISNYGSSDNKFIEYNKFIELLDKTFVDNKKVFKKTYYDKQNNDFITQTLIVEIKNEYVFCIDVCFLSDIISLDVKSNSEFNEDLVDEFDYVDVIKQTIKNKPRNPDDKCVISDITILSPVVTEAELIKKLFNIVTESSFYFENKTISIEMVATSRGELYTEDFVLDEKFVNLNNYDLHYGDGFLDFYQELKKKLKESTKGLVLLHGEPGTGKTHFIRQIIKDLTTENVKILYFPPTMVDSIIDPSFINFISNWSSSNDGKKGVILIEDAEPLLESRQNSRNIGITNLLNVTDGILNDILKIQIIATFNTKLENLDSAILRSERLIARKEFSKLTKEQIYTLIEKIDVPKEKIDDFLIKNKTSFMSLAEIYSIKKNNQIIEHTVLKKEQNKVGFKK